MPKYFLNNDNVVRQDSKIYVKGATAHHLLHVLRFKLGQPAVFCDSKGTDFYCIYEALDNKKETLFFGVKSEANRFNELPYNVTLYQSVIATGKMELTVQKSVELGVHKIVPVHTKYSSIKLSGLEKRNERFQKIAENAAEQSMRGYIPEITTAVKFESTIPDKSKGRLCLVAYEDERTTTIAKALKEYSETLLASTVCRDVSFQLLNKRFPQNCYAYEDIYPLEIRIWVGPEGGYAEEEIAQLRQAGALTITLGRRILRAETAGPAALIHLQCALQAEAF